MSITIRSQRPKAPIPKKEKEYIHFSYDKINKGVPEIVLYPLEKRIEHIGTYDSSTMIWSWAWAIPTMKKKNTTILRKILNYGIELFLSKIKIY